MSGKLYVTFDKSQEGIPTLVIMEDSYFAMSGPSVRVMNVMTGDCAVTLWKELNGKKKPNA